MEEYAGGILIENVFGKRKYVCPECLSAYSEYDFALSCKATNCVALEGTHIRTLQKLEAEDLRESVEKERAELRSIGATV